MIVRRHCLCTMIATILFFANALDSAVKYTKQHVFCTQTSSAFCFANWDWNSRGICVTHGAKPAGGFRQALQICKKLLRQNLIDNHKLMKVYCKDCQSKVSITTLRTLWLTCNTWTTSIKQTHNKQTKSKTKTNKHEQITHKKKRKQTNKNKMK